MDFNDYENSSAGVSPAELFYFQHHTLAWALTSADEPITVSGVTCEPCDISRTEATSTQELNKANVNITLPRDHPVVQLHSLYPPSHVTTVTVYRTHRDDPDLQFTVVWMGRVLNVEGAGVMATLHCEPVATSIRRIGLRQMYQRQCPHVLYSPNTCKVDRELFKVNGTFVALDEDTHLMMTVGFNPSTLPAKMWDRVGSVDVPLIEDKLSGGMVGWVSPTGLTYWRSILYQAAAVGSQVGIQINFPIPLLDIEGSPSLPVGSALVLFPGCQHTMTNCLNTFNNLPNYGGYPYIPLLNPFNGTTLY